MKLYMALKKHMSAKVIDLLELPQAIFCRRVTLLQWSLQLDELNLSFDKENTFFRNEN